MIEILKDEESFCRKERKAFQIKKIAYTKVQRLEKDLVDLRECASQKEMRKMIWMRLCSR